MRAPFRLVTDPWWVAAGGGPRELVVVFPVADEALVLATSALGLGLGRSPGGSTVRAGSDRLVRLADELESRGWAHAHALRRALSPVAAWRVRGTALGTERARVMGIVNLTADSFSGDGVGPDAEAAVRRADGLRADGADIIDVGAESARADRPALDEGGEALLVAGVVARLVGEGHIVSADTYKPTVARAALEAGAHIVNDISGLQAGSGAACAAADAGAGYVLNYSYTVPKRRPDSPPVYTDVVEETVAWLLDRVGRLEAIGLAPETIAVDPGIAFGKSHDEDLQVIRRLVEFRSVGLPVLLAHSRKNFIGSVTGRPPTDRELETHTATVLAYAQGARIFRVHDVAGTRRALDMAEAIMSAEAGAWAPAPGTWPWAADASAAHMTRGGADRPPPAGQRW